MFSAPDQDGPPGLWEPPHSPVDEHPTALPALTSAWADAFPELSRSARPRSTPEPHLLVVNDEVARDLDLDPRLLRTDAGLRFLTGEHRAPGSRPVAQVYAGHQWGVLRPLLGDGRAALLGERRDRTGSLRDIHAKGIGPTSMSRVDGFATVGPMLREFVLGEAMHALGVPTTRALAVVATGAPRLLDGEVLPGAVLTRVASSHVRYGSFEYASSLGDRSLLLRLVDHVTRRHYPHLVGDPNPARALLAAIVAAAADQTARWMGVGFVHGVLSTDNVLVSAETIDYGPCAFLDAYDPDAVFSSIDRDGRYAYGRQPEIMRWNLGRLGEALSIVLADDLSQGRSVAEEIVSTFDGLYVDAWTEILRAKLGLGPAVPRPTVRALGEDALSMLAAHRLDFTRFWRHLATATGGDPSVMQQSLSAPAASAIGAWIPRWTALAPDAARIAATNPIYVPRNHIVDEALKAAVQGDLRPVEELVEVLRTPYRERDTPSARRLASAPADAERPFVTFCGT